MVDGLRDERVRLQEQQYFLGQVLAASRAGVVILDHDGRIASVNPAAERLLQVPAADLPGTRLAGSRSAVGASLESLAPGEACLILLRRHGFRYSLDGPPGGPTRFRITFDSR